MNKYLKKYKYGFSHGVSLLILDMACIVNKNWLNNNNISMLNTIKTKLIYIFLNYIYVCIKSKTILHYQNKNLKKSQNFYFKTPED